jgi:hypothetical protein
MKRDVSKRVNRIIVRGEVTDHSHIIIGECEIIDENNEVIIKVGKNCVIKHLIESVFVETGVEKWTEEHEDILLKEGETYKFIQQVEYNPYEKEIKKVQD